MDQRAFSSMHVLVVALLMWVVAMPIQGQKSLEQCLGGCGQNVITCAEHCLSELLQENPLVCIEACGTDNNKCMSTCAGKDVPVPAPPPSASAAQPQLGCGDVY